MNVHLYDDLTGERYFKRMHIWPHVGEVFELPNHSLRRVTKISVNQVTGGERECFVRLDTYPDPDVERTVLTEADCMKE